MSTALRPVYLALYTLLANDATLAAIHGGRVFNGLAPVGTVTPYITITTESEEPWDAFGGASGEGNDGRRFINLWADTPGAAFDAMHTRVNELLHGKALTLSSGRMVSGRLRVIRTGTDPDSKRHHRVCEYRALTRAA